MKKRTILFAVLFLVFSGLFPACDIFEECGACKLITEDSNGKTEGTALPFCGDALTEKQNQLPVTVGDITTYWECY